MIMFSHKLPWSVVSRQANADELRVIDAEGETVVETGANKHLAFAICTLPQIFIMLEQTQNRAANIHDSAREIYGNVQDIFSDARYNYRIPGEKEEKEEDA